MYKYSWHTASILRSEGAIPFFLVTNGPTQHKAWKGPKWVPKTGYETKKEPA